MNRARVLGFFVPGFGDCPFEGQNTRRKKAASEEAAFSAAGSKPVGARPTRD